MTDDQRKLRHTKILDAAVELFESSDNESAIGGLEAVSFRKIAQILGCSYTSIYSYFPNKEALINAMRARSFTWIKNEMLSCINTTQSHEEQLKALADAYIRAGIERPQRYALMFFDLDQSDSAKLSLELLKAKRESLDVCTQVVESGQKAGEFPRTVDPLTATHMFWIGAHGLVSLQVSGQLLMGRDIDVLQPMLVAVLRGGLELPQTLTPASEQAV